MQNNRTPGDMVFITNLAASFFEADPQEGYDNALQRATRMIDQGHAEAAKFHRARRSAKTVYFTRNERGSHSRNSEAARFGR